MAATLEGVDAPTRADRRAESTDTANWLLGTARIALNAKEWVMPELDDLELRSRGDRLRSTVSVTLTIIATLVSVGVTVLLLGMFWETPVVLYVGVALVGAAALLTPVFIVSKMGLKFYEAEDLQRSEDFFSNMNSLEDSDEIRRLSENRFAKRQYTVRDVMYARELIALNEKYDRATPRGYVLLSQVKLQK